MTQLERGLRLLGLIMLLITPAQPQNQLPLAPNPATKSSGALFLAYRAINFSKESQQQQEKWQEIVDGVPNFLKSKSVTLVSDPLRKGTMTTEEIPMSTLLNIAKDAGASQVLYLTLAHLKGQGNATLQCLDLSGRELWREASPGTHIGGPVLVTRVVLKKFAEQVEQLKGQVARRIGQECLAVTPGPT